MDTNKLEELFERNNFDTEEPQTGHEMRFLRKLEQKKKAKPSKGKVIYMNLLMPLAGIAAAVVISFLIFGAAFFSSSQAGELASVSPEMKETQDFYTSVIKNELHKISTEKTPATEAVINDALKQLEILEKNHEKLKTDLIESGNDKRVIFAMINNYQQRIELLENLMQKIDEINQLKINQHENNIL